jgi:uncharacterized protein Yka (UPF0111/DUF47 family)
VGSRQTTSAIARSSLTEADRAADAFEEAADMLTLLPDSVHSETLARLVGLADVVLDAVARLIPPIRTTL